MAKRKSTKKTGKIVRARKVKPAPVGSHYIYKDKKGKFVKAGTQGAKRLIVPNVKPFRQPARIKGKFASPSKAAEHHRRSKAAKQSSRTRKLADEGITFLGETETRDAAHPYRDYEIPDPTEHTIALVASRETLEGFEWYYGTLKWVSREDGQTTSGYLSTPFPYKGVDSASLCAERFEELASSLEQAAYRGPNAVITGWYLHFTKPNPSYVQGDSGFVRRSKSKRSRADKSNRKKRRKQQ